MSNRKVRFAIAGFLIALFTVAMYVWLANAQKGSEEFGSTLPSHQPASDK